MKNQNLTNQNIQAISDLLDKQTAVLATKEELKDLATKEDMKDLKNYVSEGFEAVMQGLDRVTEQLAEKEKVERLIEWAREAGDKIGLKPKI